MAFGLGFMKWAAYYPFTTQEDQLNVRATVHGIHLHGLQRCVMSDTNISLLRSHSIFLINN
jgi:hypothetical protein